MVPLMKGGVNGLKVTQPKSSYHSY
jgi:hypothetical protein